MRRRRPLVSRLLVAAAALLLLRGLLGCALLALSLLRGDSRTPAILVAVEPWFVLGGLAYGGLARVTRAQAA